MQGPLNQVADNSDLMTTEYTCKHAFKGIGKLKDFQLNLLIEKQAQLVAQPLQQPAFSLREMTEKDCEELHKEHKMLLTEKV